MIDLRLEFGFGLAFMSQRDHLDFATARGSGNFEGEDSVARD